MTPPWPFSTSPHCASTEPCGDTHSLGQTRWFEIASARCMRCWSAPHPACRATETAGIKGASFHGGDACFVGIQRRFIHHNKPKPGLFGMELSNNAWAYFFCFLSTHTYLISLVILHPTILLYALGLQWHSFLWSVMAVLKCAL